MPQVYAAYRFNVDLDRFCNVTRVTAYAMALAPFLAVHPDRQAGADAP